MADEKNGGTISPGKSIVNIEANGPPQSALSILDAVTKQGADVGVIEAIAKLYREERDDFRRMAFDTAMAEAQGEMLRIAPDGINPQTHSKYATYATLDKAIRPIYTRRGFGLSFNTKEGAVPEMIRVTCHVSHRDGWSQDYQIDMPADGKGAKGGDVMTRTHATGSGLTYGRRYLLLSIFNIAVGVDDDGNAAGGKAAITQEQADELRRMAQETGTVEVTLCAAYGANSIEGIPAAMYEYAKNILRRKLDAKAGKK